MGFIYKIENIINHKIYIGQTTKKNPEKRFKEHIYKAFSSPNTFLHEAIRKHGVENFTFSVIEEVENKDLNEREMYWISYYDSYNKGYNMTLGGNTLKREKYCKVSDETILECYFGQAEQNGSKTAKLLDISEDTVYRRLKEYHIFARTKQEIAIENNKQFYKPIWQVDINTFQIVKEWKSVSEAKKVLRFKADALEARKVKVSKGYLWCYANEESYNLLISRVKDADLRRNLQYQYQIQQIDKNTNEVINTYSSIREATKALGKTRVSPISLAINGHQEIAHGYKWKKIIINQAPV